MHHKYRVQFDTKAIIEHLGGASSALEVLRAGGADISLKGVQKMRERDYISSDALATIMHVTYAYGSALDPGDFIKARESKK